MSRDMNVRLADLALRMATVFSAPSVATEEAHMPIHSADSLLGEDLPQLAQAMLVLALRMLDPILGALRHLAAGTLEADMLDRLSGAAIRDFDSAAVRIVPKAGHLEVQGCNVLPAVFLPWMASNLVGAGALLVPHPFSDPESLRRHIDETLLRIERLTVPLPLERPVAPDPGNEVRSGSSGQTIPESAEASGPEVAASASAGRQTPSPGDEPPSAPGLPDRAPTGGARADPHTPKR